MLKIKNIFSNKFSKYRFLFLNFVIFGIVWEIFFTSLWSDLFVFILMPIWAVVLNSYNLDGSISILMSSILIISALVSYLFIQVPLPERVASEKAFVWAYTFFLVGVLRFIFSRKNKSLKGVDYFLGLILKKYNDNIHALGNPNINIFERTKTFVFTIFGSLNLGNPNINIFERTKTFVFTIFGSLKNWYLKEFFAFGKMLRNWFFNKILSKKIADVIFLFIFKIIFSTFVVQILILVLIIRKIVKEIIFYKWFYQSEFQSELLQRLLPNEAILLASTIVFIYLFQILRKNICNKKIVFNLQKVLSKDIFLYCFGLQHNEVKTSEDKIVCTYNQSNTGKYFYLTIVLIVFTVSNKLIMAKERNKFEFFPFILQVGPRIISKYDEGVILGHNFKEMPFVGQVLIDDTPQKIIKWDDQKIIFEADPLLTKSGELQIVNDYGFGKGIKSNKRSIKYFDINNSSLEDTKEFWDELKNKAISGD